MNFSRFRVLQIYYHELQYYYLYIPFIYCTFPLNNHVASKSSLFLRQFEHVTAPLPQVTSSPLINISG